MEVFLRKQVEALMTSLAVREGELQQAREDRDVARTEKEAMERERNTSVHVAMERALEVRGLRERLTQMEGQPTGEAEGRGQAPEGDALWVELEAVRQRVDWLANEAALGCTGSLCELSPVPPFVTDGSFSEFRLGAGASGPLGWCRQYIPLTMLATVLIPYRTKSVVLKVVELKSKVRVNGIRSAV
ncbi:hypothetical protein C0989_006839 [Termitomyces sp. Mn162]|nr:hypothetical protein C0989_006839 [Termitomyces sp. Mn162]